MSFQEAAQRALRDWRGQSYTFGWGVLGETGGHAAALGRRALVIANPSSWLQPHVEVVLRSLAAAGLQVAGGGPVSGAAANAPRSDVARMRDAMVTHRPDVVVALGGGSTIDAAKAAAALAALTMAGGDYDIEVLFGTGEVSRALEAAGGRLTPLVAVQTAASSAAHLTKYSNITEPSAAQKKLIVDGALVPPRAVFDFELTAGAPAGLTLDGAFDGIAHCLEVFWSLDDGAGLPGGARATETIMTGLELLLRYLPDAVRNPGGREARAALGLGTDLGGYAIMTGGTSGPHLNSFSLVDVASHGRACAILNPYYTVFFAPAIEERVRAVGKVYARYGYLDAGEVGRLGGIRLGKAVARGMIRFGQSMGYPTTLSELPGFTPEHIARMLEAAKNPQLAMKLRNMPVPLEAAEVDGSLGPVLLAAASGDLELIGSVRSKTSSS